MSLPQDPSQHSTKKKKKKKRTISWPFIGQVFPFEEMRSSIFTEEGFITFKKPEVSG